MTTEFPSEDSISKRVTTGLAKIGLALRSQAWQNASRRGLTPTQGQILALLHRRDGERLRLTDLASELSIKPPTASDAVRSLLEKGLVERRRRAGDGRVLSLGLTPAGRREAMRAGKWPDFLMDAVDELAPGEQAILLHGLIKMIRALQERGQIPVAQMCVTCRFFRPLVHDDSERPHHCDFVDAPFGDAHLRIECADQQPAPADQAAQSWRRFTALPMAPKELR